MAGHSEWVSDGIKIINYMYEEDWPPLKSVNRSHSAANQNKKKIKGKFRRQYSGKKPQRSMLPSLALMAASDTFCKVLTEKNSIKSGKE